MRGTVPGHGGSLSCVPPPWASRNRPSSGQTALLLVVRDPGQIRLYPVCQKPDPLCRFLTERGQPVFHMRGHHLVGRAQDKAIGLQPLKGLGQHPLAYPADHPFQLAEPVCVALERDQDQNAPPACHVFEHLAGRTGRRHQIAPTDLFGQGHDDLHTYISVRTYEK